MNGKQKILIIEDSSEMLLLQKHILEADGFEVLSANSGAEAMTLLMESEQPDLIILDMQLEDMNGIDFLNRLESEIPRIIAHVPVVIMSGSDEIPATQAIGFIKKFPDVDVFLKKIHQFIDSDSAA